MSNIAVHMRMTGMQVTNEDVDSRKDATAELTASWGKIKDPNLIVFKANEIALAISGEGVPPDSLGAEVELCVQNHASAFLYAERPLEVGICAAMAIMEVMASEPGTTGWAIADIYAIALWSALGFQPPLGDAKREALRMELLDAARLRSIKSAEAARQRSTVGDFGELMIILAEESKVTSNFKKATAATIDALRRNAALDREEIDFLWSSQRSRSSLLGRSHRDIEEPVRVIAAGIEAAALLRRFPCDVHRDVVLKTLDRNPELDLASLITAVVADREALGNQFNVVAVTQAPGVFPLLHSLAMGLAAVSGAAILRPCDEWGSRALLEASLVRHILSGPATL
jgi:hypothetical protein